MHKVKECSVPKTADADTTKENSFPLSSDENISATSKIEGAVDAAKLVYDQTTKENHGDKNELGSNHFCKKPTSRPIVLETTASCSSSVSMIYEKKNLEEQKGILKPSMPTGFKQRLQLILDKKVINAKDKILNSPPPEQVDFAEPAEMSTTEYHSPNTNATGCYVSAPVSFSSEGSNYVGDVNDDHLKHLQYRKLIMSPNHGSLNGADSQVKQQNVDYCPVDSSHRAYGFDRVNRNCASSVGEEEEKANINTYMPVCKDLQVLQSPHHEQMLNHNLSNVIDCNISAQQRASNKAMSCSMDASNLNTSFGPLKEFKMNKNPFSNKYSMLRKTTNTPPLRPRSYFEGGPVTPSSAISSREGTPLSITKTEQDIAVATSIEMLPQHMEIPVETSNNMNTVMLHSSKCIKQEAEDEHGAADIYGNTSLNYESHYSQLHNTSLMQSYQHHYEQQQHQQHLWNGLQDPTILQTTAQYITLPIRTNILDSTQSETEAVAASKGAISSVAQNLVKIGRRPSHLPKVLRFDDKSLPAGWVRKLKQRKHGKQAGRWDVYIYSPCGVKFASRKKLHGFFEKNNLPYNPEHFDFTPYGRHIDAVAAERRNRIGGSGKKEVEQDDVGRHHSSGSTGSDGTRGGSSPSSLHNYSPTQSSQLYISPLTLSSGTTSSFSTEINSDLYDVSQASGSNSAYPHQTYEQHQVQQASLSSSNIPQSGGGGGEAYGQLASGFYNPLQQLQPNRLQLQHLTAASTDPLDLNTRNTVSLMEYENVSSGGSSGFYPTTDGMTELMNGPVGSGSSSGISGLMYSPSTTYHLHHHYHIQPQHAHTQQSPIPTDHRQIPTSNFVIGGDDHHLIRFHGSEHKDNQLISASSDLENDERPFSFRRTLNLLSTNNQDEYGSDCYYD